MKNKIYKILIIFILISLSLVVFLIYPTLKGIESGFNKIISDKSKIVFIDSEIKELEDFKKKYKEYKPNLDKIDELFFDPQNSIDFIKFLENTASATGVSADINLNTSLKSKSIENFPIAVFQIRSKGSFSNILNFAEKLEAGPYLIRIYNLTIKKLPQEKDEKGNYYNNVEANLLIEVFTK